MTALAVLVWVFTALLLFLAGVAFAAGRGRIRRNHLVGIRFPALQYSESAWEAGHAAAVFPALVACVVALVGSVIGLAVPDLRWLAVVAFVAGLIWSMVRASKAADAVSEDAP